MMPTLAVTVGEPAGIGPEISLRAAWKLRADMRIVLVGDLGYLTRLASCIDPAMQLVGYRPEQDPGPRLRNDCLEVADCPLANSVVHGKPDSANAQAVLRTLDLAVEGALQGRFDAIVTAPVQKSTINDAGVEFSGHTEYLAQRCGTDRVVMMLAGRAGETADAPMLRVALATTHLPLKDVAAAITFDSLTAILVIVDGDLKRKFGIDRPRILVSGLNPHAGEGGYLGREEIDVISPAIEAARRSGVDARGPFPADTLFQPRFLKDADCVLAMFHDQGLPVLKYATFGRGVNITLGLPIVRTSVDHGTALDIAEQGNGLADIGSMIEAMRIAAGMAASMRHD